MIQKLRFALKMLFVCAIPVAAANAPNNLAQTLPAANSPVAKNYEFKNGNWFDGEKFRRKVFYSTNNLLTDKKPARIDEVVDLENNFVVPPFADAHTHNFDGTFNLSKVINDYLREGVFYAKVQTNTLTGARAAAKFVNLPASVDVAYSHGGLDASNGHGVEVYEGLAVLRKPYAANAAEVQTLRQSRTAEYNAYYIVDTAADLEQKWQRITGAKPDFLKIYLFTSEEFEARRDRADTVGDKGLDPRLVPLIVQKAHASNLRVSAHVNTITDYRLALDSGVDEMAHLPGYYVGLNDDAAKVTLTAADARRAAKQKVWNVAAPIYVNPIDKAVRERSDQVLKNNLRLLKNAGAPIAFGSDRYGSTPQDDVFHISTLGVFDSREMLKIWCEQTPRTIFPTRKIGLLKPGYEASFLVLPNNPLENFAAVKNIRLRVKQGRLIKLNE